MSELSLAPQTQKINAQPNMLSWALAYARLGYYVLPCHEPVFDHPEGHRCTCEAYRHSDVCRRRDEERKARGQEPLYLAPDQHCKNPGKHPRGLEHGLKEATTDEATIRRWWSKYPTANIAHVPGRAGLVMLDGDSYKANYAGGDTLTDDERRTQAAISGNGGEHWYFRKHDGATYTNAVGDLPAGIDIRGDNGYALLPPSMHYSGRRYEWKDGYGPKDNAAQLLPERIHQVLAGASAKVTAQAARFTSTAAAWNGVISTERPNLDAWRISQDIRRRIEQPAERGNRSEADAKVCTALAYAGATDDQILAVFEHYPIGTAGKFAERGRNYLARTIAKARVYVEAHPPPAGAADVRAILAEIRNYVHRIDLAEFGAGGRARERNLAVADAILETFSEYGNGRMSGSLGLIGLRAKVNAGSYATVSKALDALSGWLIQRVETDEAGGAAHVYQIAPDMVTMATTICSQSVNSPISGGVNEFTPYEQIQHPTYAEYRHRDAFNATTTPITPEVIAERENSGHPFSERYQTSAAYRRRLNAALPAAGRTGLVIVDALVNAAGSSPVAHLVGLGGRSGQIIRRAIRRLVTIGLCKVVKRICYLADDWREYLDAVEGQMPTAGAGRRRMVREAARMLEAADEAIDDGNAPEWQHRRKERATMTLQRMAPQLLRHYEHKRRIDRVLPSPAAHIGKNGMIQIEHVDVADRDAWLEVYMTPQPEPAAVVDVAASIRQGQMLAARCLGDYSAELATA